MIRKIKYSDRKAILEIYAKGLASGNASFETKVPSWMKWNGKHVRHSRFAYVKDGTVAGWIALSRTSARKAYEGVCEVSVYVDSAYAAQGIGSVLMEAVIESSEKNGVWTLFASIFPENTGSIGLHEKFGFRKIGYREKIAKRAGIWRDTVIFERRSKTVGV